MMDLTPFYVAGNSEKFPVTLKGTNVLKMRTRVKMQFVASGRARRENVKAVTGPSPEKYDVPLNILQWNSKPVFYSRSIPVQSESTLARRR